MTRLVTALTFCLTLLSAAAAAAPGAWTAPSTPETSLCPVPYGRVLTSSESVESPAHDREDAWQMQ